MPLNTVPVGTIIHNVELKPGKGGQLARSAGSYVQVIGKDLSYSILRLTGEVRLVLSACMCSIGAVSNQDNQIKILEKLEEKDGWVKAFSSGSYDQLITLMEVEKVEPQVEDILLLLGVNQLKVKEQEIIKKLID